MRTANGFRCGFRKAEIADLAGSDQLGHGSDRLFDGRAGIDAMLIIKIDGVDAEALQTGIAGLTDIFGTSVDAAPSAVSVAHDTKFSGDDDLVPMRAQCPADEDLVGERTVNVGGVEEVDTELNGAVDRGDGLGFVSGTIEL